MTNQSFHQNNEGWYPQLPEGFEQNPSTQQAQRGSPLHPPFGSPNFRPPSQFPYGQGQPGNFPGRPPWQGQHPSSPSFPGASPPQQGPQSAPPNWTPPYPEMQTFAIDPGAISRCMYRFTYVWLSRRRGFWFFPVFVGRTSVAGYRWNTRRNRWEYTGIDLNNIQSFTCF